MNLNFKNPMELSYHQLIDYISELETRVTNADSGARMFKEEAQLARTELLKWKEIANQHDDRVVECHLDIEKHLEMLLRLMQAIPETAIVWQEWDILFRLLMNFTANMLRNFRETYLGEMKVPTETIPPDDIPF